MCVLLYGRMAELVDAPDLGSGVGRREGSIPSLPTEEVILVTELATFLEREIRSIGLVNFNLGSGNTE